MSLASAPPPHTHDCDPRRTRQRRHLDPLGGPALPIVVVASLLCLGVANIVARATFRRGGRRRALGSGPEGVVAAEIADGTPAARSASSRGDVLLAIDDRPVQEVADVVARAARVAGGSRGALHRAAARHPRSRRSADRADPERRAAVLFPARRRSVSSRCSSAAPCGCGVRATRRRCTSSGCRSPSSASSRSRSAAGSIVSTGCSTGATRSRSCCCRRCSCTSRWCFPERSRALDGGQRRSRSLVPLIYVPAVAARRRAGRRAGAQRRRTPRCSSA